MKVKITFAIFSQENKENENEFNDDFSFQLKKQLPYANIDYHHCKNVHSIFTHVENHRSDVILIEPNLNSNTIVVAEQIKKIRIRKPGVKIILYCNDDKPQYITMMKNNSLTGCIFSSSSDRMDKILYVLKKIYQRESIELRYVCCEQAYAYLIPDKRNSYLESLTIPSGKDYDFVADYLKELAGGWSLDETAKRCQNVIDGKEIKNILEKIQYKWNISGITALTLVAFKNDFFDFDQIVFKENPHKRGNTSI